MKQHTRSHTSFDEAFAYEVIENSALNSKIAYGIFSDKETAKIQSEKLAKNLAKSGLNIKKVK